MGLLQPFVYVDPPKNKCKSASCKYSHQWKDYLEFASFIQADYRRVKDSKHQLPAVLFNVLPIPVLTSYSNTQHALSSGRTKTYMILMIMEIGMMIKMMPEGFTLKFLFLTLKNIEKTTNIKKVRSSIDYIVTRTRRSILEPTVCCHRHHR